MAGNNKDDDDDDNNNNNYYYYYYYCCCCRYNMKSRSVAAVFGRHGMFPIIASNPDL